MKYQHKLTQLAQRELPTLKHKLIVPTDSGYEVFGRYWLEKTDRGYEVKNHANRFGTFRHSRTALAWCIADRINNINLANQILNLEKTASRYHNDITVRSHIAEKTKHGYQWETINHKMSRRRQQAQAVDAELSKCIEQAKYYQNRGFSNETE